MSCGLHDVVAFEQLGRPAVLIATDAFTDGAAAQAALLGQSRLRRVMVAHPIQDRTDEEIRALARAHVDDIVAALAGAHPPG